MDVERLVLILTTERPDELFRFYRDILGLPEAINSGPGPGLAGGAVQAGGSTIIVEAHSEISGPTREPQRHLLDLHVEDVQAEQGRLLDQGVRFVRPVEREDWGGIIATFLDPDGNYVQLVQEPLP